jgi:hypothetical protein
MQFQAKIVEGNKNPNARIAWAGGGLLFLGMVLMCTDAYRRYGFWLFGIAIVVLIVGALRSKGDVGLIAVSDTDLVVSAEEIRVGDAIYPVGRVSDIQFQVEGYDGMLDPDGYARDSLRGRRNRGHVNGMNNYLNFRVGDSKQEWQFYLADAHQAQQLGACFKELYSKRVPFVERDGTGYRTFLFEPVTEAGLEDRMIGSGYE